MFSSAAAVIAGGHLPCATDLFSLHRVDGQFTRLVVILVTSIYQAGTIGSNIFFFLNVGTLFAGRHLACTTDLLSIHRIVCQFNRPADTLLTSRLTKMVAMLGKKCIESNRVIQKQVKTSYIQNLVFRRKENAHKRKKI